MLPSHDLQIATGWLEIRRHAEYLLELGDRLIDSSVAQQGAGQIRASLRISGIDREALFELDDSFADLPLLQQRVPQIRIRLRLTGIESQRLPIVIDRLR